ncbi:hypothetical protein B5M09_010194 [Aphanomyces astaci]|uniref:Bromo domain-containing protein n=1 Tax=Aphanomyces astaci TaxID=112090 RepID=A0A3R7WAW4_APHAT|nr:hypothetical protein B5M09_010194 [Aphanomyces astaci]
MAADDPTMLGSSGGAMLQDILRTASQPEEAIVSFQKQYGLKEETTSASLQLLDLLGCRRSETHSKLLEAMVAALLKRIHSKKMDDAQLQKLLELTFPYLEMRELRAIPIAVLATQSSTPASFLQELCDHDNRALLEHLPLLVKRRIWAIAPHELRVEVDKIVAAYIQHKRVLLLHASDDPTPFDLHVSTGGHHPPPSPEDRRKHDPVLATFTDMIGDSAELYIQCIDMLRTIAASGAVPGTDPSTTNAKDYVYLASFIGTLRNDVANLQRDHATPLGRTDPLHKFIWILDHAVKRRGMERSHVTELLLVVRKLRLRDLPRKDDDGNMALPPPVPKETLLKLVDQLAKADSRRIFADPVPDDVEGYHDVITHPMDISTLRLHVQNLKYRTFDAFAADMRLIFTNCMTYNQDTTIYHKEAKRLDKLSTVWLDKAIAAAAQTEASPTCMLGTSGALSATDANDTETSGGMVFEGECDPLLADVVLVLSDPIVKSVLFGVLWRTLNQLARGSFPTDDPMVRGVVQLLHMGNVGALRRMVRRHEFVLRSPPVLSLRVALPLYCRYRLLKHQVSTPTQRSSNNDDDDRGGWDVLRTNGGSHLRSIVRHMFLIAIQDHWPVAYVLKMVASMADDEAFVKDLVFLHALGQSLVASKHKYVLVSAVMDQIWLPAAAAASSSQGDDDSPGWFVWVEPMHVVAATLLASWTASDDVHRVAVYATALLTSLATLGRER